jgi:hypothetical protein
LTYMTRGTFSNEKDSLIFTGQVIVLSLVHSHRANFEAPMAAPARRPWQGEPSM